MPRAIVDTSVLFAGAYRRDGAHETGSAILHGLDDGSLPEPLVLDYVLAETLNGLTQTVDHQAAVDFFERVDRNERFHVVRLSTDAFATATSLFSQTPPLSLVDAALVALARETDCGYVYSFDSDFDRLDDVERLDTAVDPYAVE